MSFAQTTKTGVKNAAFSVARRAGLLAAAGDSRWRAERLLILCYHGVSLDDEHLWDPQLYVSAAFFWRRLEILRDGGYSVLDLDQGIRRLQARDLPPRAVAITFDDGSADFCERACPILREFGFPATVYLTTYYCDHRWPVFDTFLSYLLWKAGGRKRDLSSIGFGAGTDSVDPRVLAGRIRAWALEQNLSGRDKDQLLRSLAQQAGIDYEALAARQILSLMDERQVREVAQGGIDIELHTHRHRVPRSRELFLRELEDNRAAIARLAGTQTSPRHFCYPSGEFDSAFFPWLEEAGVISATTCIPGFADCATNVMELPRFVDTMNVSEAVFEGWLSGASAWLAARV